MKQPQMASTDGSPTPRMPMTRRNVRYDTTNSDDVRVSRTGTSNDGDGAQVARCNRAVSCTGSIVLHGPSRCETTTSLRVHSRYPARSMMTWYVSSWVPPTRRGGG